MESQGKIEIYINGQLVGSCKECTIYPWEMTNDPKDWDNLLNEAVEEEDYETAAKIRDYIKDKS